MATTFLDLQNGFYNALSQGLGFPPGSPFQLFQPSAPLINNIQGDQLLWNYFNNIPPFSLTQDYIASGGNQFFSDYKALLSALQGAPNTFEKDVGEDVYKAWMAYVSTLTPLPAPSQLGQLFYNWASVYYPSVAVKGATALNDAALDPVLSAQLELLMVYGNRQPDWVPGIMTLVAQLSVSPALSFGFSSSSMNSDVSKSWTKGSHRGLFGLWGGSSSSSSLSEKYASGGVTLNAKFAHVLTFAATPGPWYSSAAMGLAFSKQSGPPWKSGSPIDWQNTFDPKNGNMARFTASLIVVDSMNITATSEATFSQDEQTSITQNSSAGLWPFYNKGDSSGASTSVSFNEKGQMNTTISSQPNVPIVIGCNVVPVAQFVGHATDAAQRMVAKVKTAKA